MKNFLLILSLLLAHGVLFSQSTVHYSLQGLDSGAKAYISFGSASYLKTIEVESDGAYSFAEVPSGNYFIKVESDGYSANNAVEVKIDHNGVITPSNIQLIVEKLVVNEDAFKHSWTQDQSTSGNTNTAYINTQEDILFLGQLVEKADEAAADMLHFKYNIVLSNEQEKWTQEYAYRILETMKQIPQDIRASYQDPEGLISKWVLVDEHLSNDIEVVNNTEGKLVMISKDAFVYASPQVAIYDGVRGAYFSKRLHSSLVRYVTDFGNDYTAVERILNERFGCSTNIPNYVTLTALTTAEDEHLFQAFTPEELINIVTMFEEMPSGFHVVDGLDYLVRRKNGIDHPSHPNAPAVAWTGSGYIEFMESAFSANIEHMFRLILHEKAHFLWTFVFSEEIRNDWIEIGGWYENPSDEDGWSTSLQTEFVSAYAHKKNPNEDMAESISYYIQNPELFQSRSINKYEFIRDRIMHGTRYITTIPEELTFEVLNLFPDYDYPGKIKNIDIEVLGAPEEDKVITVEIELQNVEGYEDGASKAYTRVVSTQGTFFDLHLKPTNGDSHLLSASIDLSKHAKSGNWNVDQIVVTDIVGNARFEGSEDFIWRMYVNNPLEDLISPEYVAGSLTYDLKEIVENNRMISELTMTFEVEENLRMRANSPVYVRLANNSAVLQSSTDQQYGVFDELARIATVVYRFTEYMPSGEYYVTQIGLTDEAKNKSTVNFTDSPDDQAKQLITIQSSNPDTEAPEIDLNNISITARPTNPEMPDGETIVDITYYAKDNKSGLGRVSYILRDPQGISHTEFHYHDNFYTEFFEGDPTVWSAYSINIILPKGSAPGIWGLSSMNIQDKAWNKRGYDFTETIVFNVDDLLSSTQETLDPLDFVLYPNPTRGQITLEHIDNNLEFKLFSSIGTQFYVPYSKEEGKINIDMEHLSQGLYFILIQSEGKFITKSIYLSK